MTMFISMFFFFEITVTCLHKQPKAVWTQEVTDLLLVALTLTVVHIPGSSTLADPLMY